MDIGISSYSELVSIGETSSSDDGLEVQRS
jgi:hypothetical protein